MRITDLKKELECGSKIRRSSWGDTSYIYADGRWFCTEIPRTDYALTANDLLATDWEVYTEGETVKVLKKSAYFFIGVAGLLLSIIVVLQCFLAYYFVDHFFIREGLPHYNNVAILLLDGAVVGLLFIALIYGFLIPNLKCCIHDVKNNKNSYVNKQGKISKEINFKPL